MTLRIAGKNIDIGAALSEHIDERLDQAVDKYLNGSVSGHVLLEKQGNDFRTDCALHLRSGLTLQSHGIAPDAYASADMAVERLEKRLRRYKRRISNHHGQRSGELPGLAATYSVLAAPDEEEEPPGDHPLIVAETQTTVHEFSVGDAVMQLDVSDQPVVVFRNAANGRINAVYRRADGNIGWIDPDGPGAQADSPAQ